MLVLLMVNGIWDIISNFFLYIMALMSIMEFHIRMTCGLIIQQGNIPLYLL